MTGSVSSSATSSRRPCALKPAGVPSVALSKSLAFANDEKSDEIAVLSKRFSV
jgi:hypothetical protein